MRIIHNQFEVEHPLELEQDLSTCGIIVGDDVVGCGFFLPELQHYGSVGAFYATLLLTSRKKYPCVSRILLHSK